MFAPSRLLLAILLLAGASAQADCRRDQITCTNRCELPGLSGPLAKQGETASRDCAVRCEREQVQCQTLQEQQRRVEHDDLLRPDGNDPGATGARIEAESARISALLRQRYPGKLALATISLQEIKAPSSSSAFRRVVSIGRYDAGQARLTIGIDGVRYMVGVAPEDARRFKNLSRATLSGTAEKLEPGVIELREATLSASGVPPAKVNP